MSAEPITVTTAPAEPVSRVVATNPASAPAHEQPQPQSQTKAAVPSANAAPSTNISNVRAEEKAASEEKTANNVAAARPVQPLQPVKSAEQTEGKIAAPRDAFARDHDVDVKRADAEKRRTERRQRWADKRRFQQPREQELEAVEESVREVTEPRRIRIRQEAEPREMFAEPARNETPRIRLFGQDN
jgi:hypothetical protein